jgi:hypothetical protein
MSGASKTWAERMASDPGLRAFVDAEIARAGIALAAARAAADHWKRVAEALDAKLRELTPSTEKARRANRDRQLAYRRRHQFASPLGGD